MNKTLLAVAVSFAVAPLSHAGVITEYTNNLGGYTTALGGATQTVETFGPTSHFPISTGSLNSATNLPGIGITPGLIQPGVTYSTPIGTGNFFNIDFGGGFTAGFLDRLNGAGSAATQLTATFNTNQSAFGFDTNQLMGTRITVQINFAGGGSFTDSLSILPPTGGTPEFFGFQSSATDIASVNIFGNDSTFAFAVDNFRFAAGPTTQVPEPASLLLLGLGLAGLAGARRKKA